MKHILIYLLFTLFCLSLYSHTTPTDTILENNIPSEDMPTITLGLRFTLIYDNASYAYSVSRGNATATDILIPETYNFYPVMHIAADGFRDFTTLESIIIPSSVTVIGNEAFRGCVSLTNIIIPDSVTNLGSYAFAFCENLTSISNSQIAL